MKERIEIKVSKELYDSIEKLRIEKGFEDRQDYLIKIITKEIKNQNSFFNKIKNLF